MTKQNFQELVQNKWIYLDGATGSNLVNAGMPSGVCPEQWILEHRDALLSLQREYVAAGTNILYAPTFTANRIKLAEYHLEEQLEEMICELVAISRQAAEGRKDVYVAGDLTMTGRQLAPVGDLELEELIEVYKEQIRCLEAAGVDLLAVETMMSLAEARAALIAAKEVSSLPVMVTMTFEKGGRTLFGTDALSAAVCLEALGACAVGVNCSAGPAAMREIVRTMAQAVRIPVIAKPNAGLPSLDADGRTCYEMSARDFAQEMLLLAEAGATVLGGCCGTTPEHIRCLRERTECLPVPVREHKKGVRYLSSERQTLAFTLEEGFIFVGERINPTGKKVLQKELLEGCFDLVTEYAEEQEECGARVLDINMGMSGIDEKECLLEAIEEVSAVTSLPLSLDSSHVEVLEAALRHYPGRALINSVSLEQEKIEKLLPLAAKYGAMFILLPLSDQGLPESLSEKKQIIHQIMERAFALGLEREDIIVDGLVTTVGANRQAALEALETIRYCRELGLATICGLSNISFGLPERSLVNTAFLTMAIQAGLTMAIANPSQELLVSAAFASDLLLGKEGADVRYIEQAVRVKEERERRGEGLRVQPGTAKDAPQKAAGLLADKGKADSVCEELSCGGTALYEAVVKGNRNGIAQIATEALAQGEDALQLLNTALLPAINQVGAYFDSGRYFLPQLIASAEAMEKAIEVLTPSLPQESSGAKRPVVVLASVEGDIHDIGKNLVGMMLKNYGFQVTDLGKDVPAQVIVQTAREQRAAIIGLSALMTTTMQRMREVVELSREEGLSAKIVIGGAVVTESYAREIGADGYAKDASEAVHLAKRLCGIQDC